MRACRSGWRSEWATPYSPPSPPARATASRSGGRSAGTRSQLPLLAMRRSLRRGPLALALEPELVAWPAGRDRTPG